MKKKRTKDMDELKKEVTMDEHSISILELVMRLQTNLEDGLPSTKASELLARNGPNKLTPPHTTPECIKFCKNLFGGFAILLWAGAFLCLLAVAIDKFFEKPVQMHNLYLGLVLIFVVVVTGCFQHFQESKSAKILDSFQKMVPVVASVRRNGQLIEIPTEGIVVGDIVEMKGGDRIPADIRIIKASGFKVDNSSLTGESDALTRTSECTSTNPMESKNMVFFSTNAVEGTATGIVIFTGDDTVMGRIAHLTSNLARGKTPIAKEIDHFIHIITGVGVFVGASFFAISIIIGNGVIESIIFLIGMIVANVPEGLIATVTVCLTLTAKRMAKQHCLVKNLEAVETLGSTSTICSDKTGTLTQNKMTVSHLWRDRTVHKVHLTVAMESPDRQMVDNDAECALILISALCNRAFFKPDQTEIHVLNRKAVGDASEVALLQYAECEFGNAMAYREQHPKMAEIPFNSNNKYQVSIHEMGEGKGYLLVMKGAPERIFARCSTLLSNGKVMPITDEIRRDFDDSYHHLGGKGERVLGFCHLMLDQEKFPYGFKFETDEPNFPLIGLTFVGLISMIDPPREGVARSVLLCQEAGIRVVMVTGDHPITAQAIATKVHIIERGANVVKLVDASQTFDTIEAAVEAKIKAIVVHGEQLRKLTPQQLDFIVTHFEQVVFSRTSPAQKLNIVESYQRSGKIVAVTGDGVNDAPALRKADIGIAMGIAGTEVSKQAADMILMNDNFASIVTGIEEGRIIFDNLKKSISYTLTSNIPEISPFLLNVTLGIPLAMSIIGILCIDLGTDLLPAISLAYEEAESDIMKRPPRNAKYDKLVNWRMINFSYMQIGILQALAGYATYFFIYYSNGIRPEKLLFIRERWETANETINVDGIDWDYDSRKSLERSVNAAFFYAIVVVQWVDLVISKTRRNSLLTQRLTNQVLNFSLGFTVFLTVIILYMPFLQDVLMTSGIRMRWAFVAIPFAWLIFLYDETRRYFIRKNPQGIVAKLTYY